MSSQSTPILNQKPVVTKAAPQSESDKTTEVSRLVVDFYKDVLPYYLPCATFFVQHLVYFMMNGNLLWVMLFAYVVNFPYYQHTRKKPRKETNLDRESENVWKKDWRFMGPLYAYVAADALTWLWCMCVVSGMYPPFLPAWLFEDKITKTVGGFVTFTFVWGYMAGVNGLAGHELIHRKGTWDKGIGMFTFSKIFYSHFLLEHGSGHHRNVATPEDSATARKGETFLFFAFRSAVGGHVNTWNREVSRLQIKCKSEHVPMVTLLTQNRMTWFFALHVAMAFSILGVFGTRALLFQVVYALVGIFFIELINYTEHYGLLRQKDARGIYEPINEQHSWNASSSHLLFRIQRHSDHHMHAYRPYQILRKFDEAPMMPYMYLYSLLLALCPPLWFSTMDQLLINEQPKHENANRLFFLCFIVSLAYSTYCFI